MRRVLFIIVILLVPSLIMAQASGGQITRNTPAPKVNKKVESSSSSPRIKVLSEKEKTCELTKMPSGHKGSYKIPSEVRGYTVIKLGSASFSGCNGITSVIIPRAVKEIGEDAFSNCKSLIS